jgi:hypothetical protein
MPLTQLLDAGATTTKNDDLHATSVNEPGNAVNLHPRPAQAKQQTH